MAAGTIEWSGTFTLPKSGPGVISSIAVSLAGVGATDRIVCTPSYTSQQSGFKDVNNGFRVQIVKSAGVGFTAYADRPQLPADLICDYIMITNSS